MRIAASVGMLLVLVPLGVRASSLDGTCAAAPADATSALASAVDSIAIVASTVPFHVPGLPDADLATALRAYQRASVAGIVKKPRLTIVDYSLPSTERRLWVIDPATGKVLFHELVAHGRGSGLLEATMFGNTPGSFKSSLGVFRTAETYRGKHGESLRIDGLEPGVNDKVRARAIVVHSADYVSEGFIQSQGYLGRSEGCLALDGIVAHAIIHEIQGGSLIVSVSNHSQDWIARSRFARLGD